VTGVIIDLLSMVAGVVIVTILLTAWSNRQ